MRHKFDQIVICDDDCWHETRKINYIIAEWCEQWTVNSEHSIQYSQTPKQPTSIYIICICKELLTKDGTIVCWAMKFVCTAKMFSLALGETYRKKRHHIAIIFFFYRGLQTVPWFPYCVDFITFLFLFISFVINPWFILKKQFHFLLLSNYVSAKRLYVAFVTHWTNTPNIEYRIYRIMHTFACGTRKGRI